MTTTSVSTRRGILGNLGNLVFGVLLALLFSILALFLIVPRVMHGAALTVLTGSMEPDLPVGSVVLTRSVSPDDLKVGDIAVYQQPGGTNLITHRIVAVDGSHSTFTFQGDRNPVPDPVAVPARAIKGKIWLDVPFIGRLGTPLGHRRPVIVLVCVVALGGFSLWQFSQVFRDRRRRA